MRSSSTTDDRRRFLKGMAFTTAAFTTPGLLAEELMRTVSQTEGPFYPDKLPLDTDNDLLTVNDAITPAVGKVTHLSGRILDSSGDPIRNAVVEIWQADNGGAYLHSRTDNADKRDSNFQGFGRFLTGSSGEYYFRTIRPVPYTFRTPHIHFAIEEKGRRVLTTQLYVEGEPLNQRDPILAQVRDPKARQTLMAEFKPLENSRAGELAANFDIVLGVTPEND